MSTICVLKTANVASSLQEQPPRRSDCRPVSLLAFLQAENRKLHDMVAQLERDTMALREALQSN
jgi:hypothetical protein